jgi:ABC-type branched-subunit amino acid transport system ATPase component
VCPPTESRDLLANAPADTGARGAGQRDAGQSPPPPAEFLRVEHLAKSFGGLQAVKDASFAVSSGGITGLIGPNGAGKSTAVNVIAGLVKPDHGSVRFGGRDIAGLPAHEIARMGVIRTFQKANLFGRMTVMENLLAAMPRSRGEHLAGALFGRRRWRQDERHGIERARSLMTRFKMDSYEDTYAGELSGGEKRMVELMRALMAQPKLLILDEPMAGINPTRAWEIGGYLLALAGEGLTMLLVEHELSFVERVCDRVVVMAQGRVLAEGSMLELRSNQEVVDAYLS